MKAEWQEKQKKKQERGTKERELKEKEKEEEDENSKSRQKEELKVLNPPGSLSVSQSITSQPIHDRYILHRDFFAS